MHLILVIAVREQSKCWHKSICKNTGYTQPCSGLFAQLGQPYKNV